MQDITTKKKKKWFYLPYISAFCFVTEIIGVAVWDIYSRAAVKATHNSLALLGLNIDTALVWSSAALAFTVAMLVIFALCMLALGVGRSLIAYKADRTGATRMGGRLILWMWLDAVFILLWFLLTLWLLVLLLGQCLWMAAAWGLNTSIQVGAGSAQAYRDAGINTTITHNNDTTHACGLACIDLYAFEWALKTQTCFCNLTAVVPADQAMKDALGKMEGSVAGAVMLLISGMWILMAAASEFGVTRRERQLLRRIAKARMAQGTELSKLLPGNNNSGGIVGFGSGKKKKGGQGGLQAPPQVLVDPETGEVLDVQGQLPDDPAVKPATKGAGAGNSSGTASSSGDPSLPDGLKRSSSLVKTAKVVGKGLAKTGKVFDYLGSFMNPLGRK